MFIYPLMWPGLVYLIDITKRMKNISFQDDARPLKSLHTNHTHLNPLSKCMHQGERCSQHMMKREENEHKLLDSDSC